MGHLLVLLLIAFFCAYQALSKDLGTHGHIYQIAEPDLLQQITRKLGRLENDGKLAHHNRLFLEKAQKSIRRPPPVNNISKALETREFFYDPSIQISSNLKDHKGRVFHKAGSRLNPLTYRSLTRPLAFIDGDDKAQVVWASQLQGAKIILTSGSPYALMEILERPIYFDQGGRLTSKLGIKHVPTLVVQEDLQLKITEIPSPEVGP